MKFLLNIDPYKISIQKIIIAFIIENIHMLRKKTRKHLDLKFFIQIFIYLRKNEVFINFDELLL